MTVMATGASEERLRELCGLPWHIEIVHSETEDGDSGWVAEVRELPGCIAQGRTPDELFANIDRALQAWIWDAMEYGDPIPEPIGEPSHSGKVLVRMPPYLHGELAAEAERQGVSLNQLAVSLLARGCGEAAGRRAEESAALARG